MSPEEVVKWAVAAVTVAIAIGAFLGIAILVRMAWMAYKSGEL